MFTRLCPSASAACTISVTFNRNQLDETGLPMSTSGPTSLLPIPPACDQLVVELLLMSPSQETPLAASVQFLVLWCTETRGGIPPDEAFTVNGHKLNCAPTMREFAGCGNSLSGNESSATFGQSEESQPTTR